jgi:hypothetical protein
MGYRGEDVPTAYGDWGRQQPRQPSSGISPGDAGAWDDGSQGYSGDVGYPAGRSGGYGYGPGDGYPGQEQPGYGPRGGQYAPYPEQPYEGYGPGQGQGGYGAPSGYQGDDYRYAQPGDYGRQAAGGYGVAGYQDQNPGYGRSGGYPASPAGGPSAQHYGSAGYPALTGGSGSYPAQPDGSGGYPASDAGNDWYGGQPDAAKGASFADTGAYAFNGRAIDEYGTGPRAAMRDPVRGYPPGPGWQGSGPLPVPGRPALPASPRASSPPVAETRQQERLDEPPTRDGRAATGGFRVAATGGFRNAASGDFPRAASGGLPRAASGNFPQAASGSFRQAASGGFQGAAPPDAFEGRGGYRDYPDDFNDVGAVDDPYADRGGATDDSPKVRGGGRGSGKARGSRPPRGPLGGKRLLVAALGVVAFGVLAAAVYVFALKPSSPSSNSIATGPLSTNSAQPSQQACVKQLGTYCHIEAATDDPKPLTVAELYPPAFTNDTDKTSASLVSTKLDTKCANAVIGQDLIKALQTYKCTQVVRASYVSSNGKIMGTIGVVNLATTNGAHYAGKVIGKNDFVAPLMSKTGVASKLGNGTGLVEADFKGHYLILTWSEYVNGTVPSTQAQDNPLKQFSSDLVASTANIALTQRMVTGAPASSGTPS